MYCMPQLETRVNLVVGSGEGADALISSCIRTNGAECEETGKPSRKCFHTEFGKGMELYPESMSMAGGIFGNLMLDDASGASLTSARSLIVCAKGKIRLEGGKIIDMETLSGIFAETLQAATSSLCISGRFDYLSAGTLLQGRVYQAYPPFDDAPKEGHFDWGGFFRNIAIGLAVVAVFAVAAAAVVATGGGAAAFIAGTVTVGTKVALGACLGAAIGAAMTTARIAVEDFNDGDVRSWQEASREIGISALSGAITGALGARFPHMNKLLAGLIDTTLSTVERGFLKAFEEDVTFGEWLAYTFDPKTIIFDFVVGVAIDFLIDGITDRKSNELFDYADGKLDDIPASTWDKGPIGRGDVIDQAEALRNNLGHNFPTIDSVYDRIAASTKSYDITSGTYTSGSGWWYRLKKDIDKLNSFSYGKLNDVIITSSDFDSKCLNIVLPNIELSEVQKAILQKAKDYAKNLGIIIKVFITN